MISEEMVFHQKKPCFPDVRDEKLKSSIGSLLYIEPK